ncbi:MAG: bifunctional diaminohydroxyphosphoribosylaminopyrimidine deaminase/5-amino-6-(5-phosphoribosylamino)uracil reductase RibD [Gemmatimonadetes bacterium]|nr:bifunctional diaminohydroxyphosphoribosylaminopyrimidine deaminase/5-amino-6-(5-phosphoribosylamino)uracil reductase RibD [Gemmatimonadota bacterium]NIR77038.1 bifunctional diaminohydroxyphosphoribosylaminopyrimidine deaminase/5-amino-6-(5-phosphoribosylamino)uracil reductase RibD [Gemmatimonadota bacterium]NIT88483.1 bifunctional diaminohydroxyphosphoribosylaminopyrimidine deaminase/5-amino-6-(5-phosphoribosylamino)uracil reductase RibD [Gemmatimonadota bacterium]NIU32306.1 bifunctional diam
MAPEATTDDRRWLEGARKLARRGWGHVHPNPLVGCVLVREGESVAEGWHREFGGPHAEVEALRRAGEKARGATAYVSLEPCAHHGKTPPCADALAEAGVERVVYGGADPTVEAGGGAARLREAGVEVVGPVLSREEARRDNPTFFLRAEGAGPWTALKLAMSLDGGIAARPGCRTALTGPEAAEDAHRLRAGFDAILVGSRTVEVDDPRLTVRDAPSPRVPPVRVVADSGARMRPDAALLSGDGPPVWIAVSPEAPRERTGALEEAGARVLRIAAAEGGIDLGELLDRLREEGIRAVLCEGGGVLASALLREGRVHRVYLYVAPRLLGEDAVPAFSGPFREEPLDGWTLLESRTLGRDGRLVWDAPEPGTDGPEPTYEGRGSRDRHPPEAT